MWGVVPAAGEGSRLQPLAFSKELLPIGGRLDPAGERPKAVSEHLVDRMTKAGVDKLCFVIGPRKSDIVEYFGGRLGRADITYVVQPKPAGLCDAVFRAELVVDPREPVVIGLPDTIWFPEDALRSLPDDRLSLLLFEVARPDLFDSVALDETGRVRRIAVKSPEPLSRWIWGALKMPGAIFHELAALWRAQPVPNEYLGALLDVWINQGGEVFGYRAMGDYYDVGTLEGYRAAIRMLQPAFQGR